jgi:hypothetical protein
MRIIDSNDLDGVRWYIQKDVDSLTSISICKCLISSVALSPTFIVCDFLSKSSNLSNQILSYLYSVLKPVVFTLLEYYLYIVTSAVMSL